MKFVAAIFIFCLVPQFDHAQILNQIGNSIKTSTETKATDHNRTRSNKEHLQTPENANPNPPSEDIQENNPEKEMDTTIHSPADFNPKAEYVFDTKILFKVFKYEQKQLIDTNHLVYTFNDSVFMFTSSEQGVTINDYRCYKMMILDAASKSGMTSRLISPEIMRMTYQAGILNTNYIKTGKSKTIAGYTCHEYKYTDPLNKQISMWVSAENPLKDKNELVKYSMDLFFMNLGIMSPEPGSVTMGLDFANEKGEIEQSILYQSISSEENKFSLGEYQLISY